MGNPDGWVAHSTYWLIESSSELVGVTNLRHELSDSLLKVGGHIGFGIRPSRRRKGYGKVILQKAMERAKARAIPKVLVTCDKSNIASARIIQSAGGVFEGEEYVESEQGIVQRYWIEI